MATKWKRRARARGVLLRAGGFDSKASMVLLMNQSFSPGSGTREENRSRLRCNDRCSRKLVDLELKRRYSPSIQEKGDEGIGGDMEMGIGIRFIPLSPPISLSPFLHS
jgi:hypothetical protein